MKWVLLITLFSGQTVQVQTEDPRYCRLTAKLFREGRPILIELSDGGYVAPFSVLCWPPAIVRDAR